MRHALFVHGFCTQNNKFECFFHTRRHPALCGKTQVFVVYSQCSHGYVVSQLHEQIARIFFIFQQNFPLFLLRNQENNQKCLWFRVWALICSFSVLGGTFGTLWGPFMDPLGFLEAPYGPFRAPPGPLWALQGSSRSSDWHRGHRSFFLRPPILVACTPTRERRLSHQAPY